MNSIDIARICSAAALGAGMTLLVPGCAGEIISDPDATQQGVNGASSGSSGRGTGGDTRNDGYGLTFGLAEEQAIAQELVHPSCHGFPKNIDRDWSGSCNPYAGDTSCERARPVLCVRMEQVRPPASFTPSFYNGWAPGTLASTRPIVGKELRSLREADALCTQELGPGFRMAEFHDGGGGWTFTGKRGAINAAERHWVYINDQHGNCWDAATRAGQ